MKTLLKTIMLILGLSAAMHSFAQSDTLVVETSCGQCQFQMKDKPGCDLAVRMDGQSYFVEGTTIDAHGDAHATDGFCNSIRKAKVIGQIEGAIFRVSWFKLLPEEKE